MKKLSIHLLFTLAMLWMYPLMAQTIDASKSFQMLTRPDGSTKRFGVTTTSNTSRKVLAYHTYGRREKLTIRFQGDWLDITDEVRIGGKGISNPRITKKGKENNIPYCEVTFRIAANATEGDRRVRLRRPAFLSRHETVYTINLQKNVRISSPSPVFTTNSNDFGSPQTFSITAEGMSKWVRTDQPLVPENTILRALLLFTTNNESTFDFRAVFRSVGSITYRELFSKFLIMTTGAVAVHMGESLSMRSKVLVAKASPPPLALSSGSLNLGSLCIGTRAIGSTTITNTTANPISIGVVRFSGAEFNPVTPLEGTVVAPGGSLNFTVRFQPRNVGVVRGNVEINHSAGAPINLQLTGSGASPLSISEEHLSFGNTVINTNQTRTVILANTCGSPVTINSLELTNAGDLFTFSGVNNGAVVPANGSMVMTVNFRPRASGEFSNNIRITPALGNVMNLRLSGSGIAPALSVSLLNTFSSDAAITNTDRESYNLCPIQVRDNIPINTAIPSIEIRVTNAGLAVSPATTVVFTREDNNNFSSSNARVVVNIPVIQPGSQALVRAPLRLNSLVCTVKTQGICDRCNAAINPHWNDVGVCASLTPVAGDDNTFNDKICVR
jgi:hypothetical protein